MFQPTIQPVELPDVPVATTSSQPGLARGTEPEHREPTHLMPANEAEPTRQPQSSSGPATDMDTSKFNLPLNIQDIAQLIKSFVRPQITYDKNIIPIFDPTQKNQRIEGWIAKVNECAKIYNWTDEQTTHFALPKLGGHAKKWYEGLHTILFTWNEWQSSLIKTFSSETNYGAILSDMLERRMKFSDSVDEYYYDKMILLNACDIVGKKAVDCLVHGIDDRMIRASASAAKYQNPEDLLSFLKNLSNENHSRFSKRPVNSRASNDNIVCFKCNKIGHLGQQCRIAKYQFSCFNCKDKGHVASKCPKSIIKCDNCHRFGHKTSDCYRLRGDNPSSNRNEKRTMLTQKSRSDSKYYKTAIINDTINIESYVDFGSDCTLIRQDIVEKYSLPTLNNDLPNIRGFGNGVSTPLGKTKLKLCIGEVTAEIDAYIIETSLLTEPLLIGQDFTEREDVLIIKTHNKLDILKRKITDITDDILNIQTDTQIKDKIVLRIKADTVINNLEFVHCSDDEKNSCDVYIEDSVRTLDTSNYSVIGGVYRLADGDCQVAVSNLSKDPIFLSKNSILVRGKTITLSDQPTKTFELNCNQINCNSVTPITLDEIQINPNLTQPQQHTVVKLINEYRDCFARNLSELGCTKSTEMNIELSDTNPVVYRPYRLSHTEKLIVRDMVKDLIDNDIAEESSSCYASPVILVKKKTGGYRLCVDFRALNRKIKKDHFPMPRIDDQLDMLNGNTFYTSLDLASGYYQIPISDACKHLTAFITPDGLYQFKKMPFGLVNSPAVFQRTINQVLGNARFNSAIAYMDDILVPGKNFEEGLERLENVFKLLRIAKLTLNLQKCDFFQKEIEYLGYEIGEHGIRPGKTKIVSVEQFPTPRNVHEVRQFVGLASYFRKFIRNFAIMAKPLTDLTRKGIEWHWGIEQNNSFQHLKTALIQRPVLGIYDPQNETHLHTDASKHGLAGILLQKNSETDELKPIAYFSRKTSIEEQNYHAYELETLAVIASLQRFRVYLIGVKFTLVTDCSALRSTFSKRDLIPRIARWWIAIQEFDFEIKYKPGHSMSHVDALSRNPLPYESDIGQDTIPFILRISQEDWLLTLQLNDSESLRLRKILEDTEYSDVKKNYVLKNNRLFRKVGDELKWLVPKHARFQLCKINHDDIGHFGLEKTLDKISKDFWFPKMKRFIEKYVRSCIECAYSKEPTGPKEGLLHPIHKVDKPFDTVHVDHLGPFVKSTKGKSYLIVLVDGFTKFCILTPLKNLKTTLSIQALDNIFCTFGYPDRLISDQGTSFTSNEFKQYCKDSNVNHILNAVASPRANGQVERYNRTVLNALTAYTDKLGEKYWDKELGKLQWGLNNTLNKGIGKTPSEALFGIQMVSKGDNMFSSILKDTRHAGAIQDLRKEISNHIEKDQQKQKNRYDKTKIKAKIYKLDDLVKILKPVAHNDGKSKKLLPKFSGPFRITKVLENDRYEVSSIPGTKITTKNYCNIFSADRIKPWISTLYTEPTVDSTSSDTDTGDH